MQFSKEQLDKIIFDYVEGNLTAAEELEIESYMADDPRINAEIYRLSQTRLKPDNSIQFELKASLKKSEVPKIRFLYYATASVAAALIISFFLFKGNPDISSRNLAANNGLEPKEHFSHNNNPQIFTAKDEIEPKTEVHMVSKKKQAIVNEMNVTETYQTKRKDEHSVIEEVVENQTDQKIYETASEIANLDQPADIEDISGVQPSVALNQPQTIYPVNNIEVDDISVSKKKIRLWDIAEKIVGFADKKVKPKLELENVEATDDASYVALNMQFRNFGIQKKFNRN